MDSELWGAQAIHTAFHNEECAAQVEQLEEVLLLVEMRRRVGPYASELLMLRHLRTSRGKVHWAVNSYFRQQIQSANPPYDFEVPRSDNTQPAPLSVRSPDLASDMAAAVLAPSQSAAVIDAAPLQDSENGADAGSREALRLNLLPGGLLEHVLRHCRDHLDVCHAAQACRSFREAATSESLWETLGSQRWGLRIIRRAASLMGLQLCSGGVTPGTARPAGPSHGRDAPRPSVDHERGASGQSASGGGKERAARDAGADDFVAPTTWCAALTGLKPHAPWRFYHA
ncbi:hypothetical protein CYMTET_19925, partial [Cymbomonas tetramitiformis]